MNEQEEVNNLIAKLNQWEAANQKATFTEIEEAVDAELLESSQAGVS